MTMTPKLEDIAGQQQNERPGYFEDPAADRALALLLEALEEVCVLTDRLDTMERLADAGMAVSAEAVDGFEIDETVAAERLARHQALFSETFERLRGEKPVD